MLLIATLLVLPLPPQVTAGSTLSSRAAFDAAELPVRFVILGDYGTTAPATFAVAARVHALEPRFLLTLGDNNYPSGSAATIDANIGQHYHDFIAPYTGGYGARAVTNRFFPCLGNHDWLTAGALPYLAYFALPGNERYYDFRRGPVHFFAVDSDPSEPDGILRDSVQAAWLEDGLRRSNAPFKLVYMHHAPYDSCDTHGSQGDLQWPFREWGASLVLAGHDHVYERLSVTGLPYVVNGLGGQDRYGFLPPIGGSELRTNAAHGAVLAEADVHRLHLRFVTSSDEVLDDFWLPRGGIDPGSVELVPEDAAWRYLDTGVAPAPDWAGLAFDDSGWAVGQAQLGYGDGDEATVVNGGPASNHFITTWFRTAFTVADPLELETLQLRLLHDDGAVVYLNGAEVARSRMPAGTITGTTHATVAVSGNEERTFYPFTFDTAALVAGLNVLAIEIHQSSPTSSDISLAAELVGLRRGQTLVARGSDWRYLDTGVAPGPGWSDSSFDDSAWASGAAQLGRGEGDEVTVTADLGTTIWFRRSFPVSGASAIRWLDLRLLRDDGAIVYLNGVEAARFDLPRTGVTPATPAPYDVTGVFEGRFERTSLDPRLLHDGTNTLAIELHDSTAAEHDLSFDLELVAH